MKKTILLICVLALVYVGMAFATVPPSVSGKPSIYDNWNTAVYENGTVGFYRFDNESAVGENDSLVYDWSGTGNNGSIVGNPTLTNGQIGNSYYFNGTTDYVKFDSIPTIPLNLSQSGSISLWINLSRVAPDSGDGKTQIIASIYNSGEHWGGKGIWLYQEWSTIGFVIRNGALSQAVITSNSGDYFLNNWRYIVSTWNYDISTNNLTLKMYDSGKLVDEASLITGQENLTFDLSNFRIARSVGTSYWMNGSIDELAIYNRSLSSSEILDIYIQQRDNCVISYENRVFNSNVTLCADTYYVNQSGGNNSKDGLSPNNAWKTISQINTPFKPNSSILFARGEIWRSPTDAYMVLSSGNSIGNITYSSYGVGSKPIILGSFSANSTDNWTRASGTGNIWNTTFTITKDVGNIILIFSNGTIITTINKTRTYEELNEKGEFYYNGTTNITSFYFNDNNPASIYSEIELATKNPSGAEAIIEFTNNEYVVIENLSVKYGGRHGISGNNVNNIFIINNEISYIGGEIGSGGTIRIGNCIQFGTGSNYVLVTRNNITQCYDAGLSPQSWETSTEVLIANQEWSYNLVTFSHYPFEYFSNTENSDTHNISIHHNTFVVGGEWSHNQRPDGGVDFFNLGKSPENTTSFNITDNIFYGLVRFTVILFNTWQGDINMDYNIHFNQSGDNIFIGWNGTNFEGLDAFKSTINQEANGQEADPLFTDFANGDFRPQYNSPACTMSSTGSYVGALPCLENSCINPAGRDWELNMSHGCNITTTIDLRGRDINLTDTGNVYFNSTISFANLNNILAGMTLWILENALLNITG